MEMLIKLAWGLLALVHVSPAAVLFSPVLVRHLYGIDAGGDVGVLIVHRGALFLAVVAVCVLAAFEPGARRAAGLVTAISVVGFLVVHARAGFPGGALRIVALCDSVALAPLTLVLVTA